MMAVFPPFLTIMSVPVFDIIPLFQSGSGGGFNTLAILLVPFAMPLIISFTLTFGYVLLYMGRALADSSMGRSDHPRYPLWDWQTIVEGIGRWIWAGIIGVGIGGMPAWLYGQIIGHFGPVDQIILALLLGLGIGYAQMGLAIAILHDNLASAHPMAIGQAIARIGRDYLMPWLVTTMAVLFMGLAWYTILALAPNLAVAAAGLWGFWVFFIYQGMVVMHVLGWCCFRNGAALGWFRHAPRWGSWDRPGRLYTNS